MGKVFVAGCFILTLFLILINSDNFWLGFARGTTIPNARLELVLPEPLTSYEQFNLYEQAAILGGYPFRSGGPISAEELEVRLETHRNSHRWYATNETGVYHYNVFFTTPRGEGQESTIEFIYHNDSTEKFTEDDWLTLIEWKDDYLPQVFPEASISVSRHPARFTDREDIPRLVQETGLTVPPDMQEWLDRTSE